jgi:hypothetical protein
VTLPVKLGDDVKADLASLSPRLLEEAFGLMARLRSTPLLGIELGHHPTVGNLAGCRKLYFNEARHRIVYRVAPNETKPTSVEIIVVGARANLAVYYEAAKRLGREPGRNAPFR